MREIKFRGKRVDNGEWVYGAFVPDALETPDNDLITWGFIRRYNRDIGKMETIEVARESVGQYTGLKHMCNGDIIDDGFGIGIVEYVSNYAAFRVNYQNGACKWFYDYLDSELKCIEIIGNIHDNPDLLEVTE